MRDCAFENGKAKRLNNGSVGVLSNGQYDAIALLRCLPVIMMIVTVLRAIGVFVTLDASGVIFLRGGNLLEEMMDPMGRRKDQEEQKRDGCAQIETAPADRRLPSTFHY